VTWAASDRPAVRLGLPRSRAMVGTVKATVSGLRLDRSVLTAGRLDPQEKGIDLTPELSGGERVPF
jgi:hypothetical protein